MHFHVSQGGVTTCLRCDGIYYTSFIGSLVLFPLVEKKTKVGLKSVKI